MARTVDCGEGRHGDCSGTGHRAYMFPQEDRRYDEPPFACGCICHHNGEGVPCTDCPPVRLPLNALDRLNPEADR